MTEENGDPKEETFEPEVETQKIWRMPEPVFRTSEGTEYCRVDIEEDEEDLHETHEQIPSSQAKSSKMPFLLGGAFIVFFVATVFLAGIWFLFLRNIEPPKILTPEVEKSTPAPDPTASPTETPAPTATPNEIPGATPTEVPAPNPGGEPVNS
jgi:hypothetical protein